MAYTDETALELARQLGPLLGLTEVQLPSTVFADVLNGLAECQVILDGIPQQESPVPLTQTVPGWSA